MSLLGTRDAIVRRSGVRTAVLLVAVVAALIVGLLAMHTFSSPMGSQNQPEATMAMDATPHGGLATGGHTASTPADCLVTCDLGHSMPGMMCVLALLFTALSLAAATAANVTAFGPGSRQALSRMIAFAAVPGNPPPDLNALSISRT